MAGGNAGSKQWCSECGQILSLPPCLFFCLFFVMFVYEGGFFNNHWCISSCKWLKSFDLNSSALFVMFSHHNITTEVSFLLSLYLTVDCCYYIDIISCAMITCSSFTFFIKYAHCLCLIEVQWQLVTLWPSCVQRIYPEDSQSSGGRHKAARVWSWSQSGETGPGCPVFSIYYHQIGRCGQTRSCQLGFWRPRDPGMDSITVIRHCHISQLGMSSQLGFAEMIHSTWRDQMLILALCVTPSLYSQLGSVSVTQFCKKYH